MRFVYGLVLGVLVSVVVAILYLALAGGDYLLVLSPKYQEMRTRVASLEKAEQQRDQLARRLEDLEKRFTDLSQRFSDLERPAVTAPPPEAVMPVPTPEG